MKRLIFVYVCSSVVLFGFPRAGWCVDPSQTVDMTAQVQSENSISVSISKIVGTTWSTATAVAFGQLNYDSTNNIFTAGCYYAVDVNVNSNATNWTVTHTINKNIALTTDATKTLNDNINVSFVKQNASTSTELGKYSLTKSNNKAYTKSQIGVSSGNWLRIYYGIATGTGDGEGAVPVTSDKPAGTYSGQVKVTLTAS
ncbi:MAG: hypothetical protein PHC33_03550 [Candidatus Omnitrophica bacterium]|nr:hypothetical protein [Candidatus Omnitrophota bacterium]